MIQHARPKSQPALKYVSPSSKKASSLNELAAELIVKEEVVSKIKQPLSGRYLRREIPSSSLTNISSASSEGSSDSSLASSLASLSTNGSTSTVLANLETGTTRYNGTPEKQASAKQQNFQTTFSDEEDQLHSSSSSTSSSSSSSGLSSMNSKSSSACQANREAEEVRQCVADLVQSVASKEEQPFSSFKLEEVVLTQTRTISSGSSDEETSAALAAKESTLISECSTNKENQIKLANLNGKIYLARELEINSEFQSSAFILHSARRYIASVLAQKRKAKGVQTKTCWYVSLLAYDYAIEWTESNRLDQSERLEFAQIIDCLIEDQLLVWVIERNRRDNKVVRAPEAPITELETTLDDIAMALDEPVESLERAKQQDYGVETLIWLCSSEEEAKKFFDQFKVMRIAYNKQGKANTLKKRQQDGSSVLKDHQQTNEPKLMMTDNEWRQKQRQQVELDFNPLGESSCLRKQSEKVESTRPEHHQSSVGKETPVALVASNEDDLENNKPNNKEAGEEFSKSIVDVEELEELPKGKRGTSTAMDKVTGSKAASGALKKSASGLDLSQSSLASYYRSVASKVISNGQSKIKSLKDEMIKLNNRSSSSTVASGKRLSIAVPSGKSLSAESAESNRNNLSSNSKANERQGTLSAVSNQPITTTTTRSSSKLPLSNDQQVPEIKPRTSILKNRHQKAVHSAPANTCDINHNILQYERRKPTSDKDDQSAKSKLSNKCDQNPTNAISTTTKPKSILKSSRTVSNVAIPSMGTLEGTGEEKTPSEFSNRMLNQNLRSMRRVYPRASSSNSANDKRMSCAIVNRKVEDEFDEDKFEAQAREQSFERLRMRASCYDISRLMSKNGLQSQLDKLRSGSSSSISAKSRQRRPALLIENNSSPTPPPTSASIACKPDSSTSIRAKAVSEQQQLQLRSLSESQQSKRSEFDPRSLRRIGQESGSKLSVTTVNVIEHTDKNVSERAERRKSVTMIKLTQGNSGTDYSKPIEAGEEISRTIVNVSTVESRPKQLPREVGRTKETSDIQEGQEAEEKDDEGSLTEIEDEESQTSAQTSSLTKSGAFSLLRQSFSQKSISSMLKFSSRASLRVKSSPPTTSTPQTISPHVTSGQSKVDKSAAIAAAEANLLAAKQLKHQAQKLKEQQKRELQQQQAALLDPTSVMLAMQYNQQLQRQQQQQQMLYQQYAIAARGQMFDATSLQIQHTQMVMQRQQQQMAYMASLSNQAHYMAQQMAAVAVMQHQPAGTIMTSHQQQHHQQHLLYPSPPQMQQVLPVPVHNSSGVSRKSILKGSGPAKASVVQDSYQAGHLIPMAVNHHSSSFNIVYNAPPNVAPVETKHHQQQQEKGQESNPKHSSLGASMRKTVKSILVNKSAFLYSSNSSAGGQARTKGANNEAEERQQPVKVLKSALKSSQSRPLILNSEGSDSGDSSSSDSTTTATTSSVDNNNNNKNAGSQNMVPKSVLKKSIHHEMHDDGDNSSDSSNELPDYSTVRNHHHKSSTLTRASASDLRQTMKASSESGNSKYSTIRSSKRKSIGASNELNSATNSSRKNVTFSAKLTSIL